MATGTISRVYQIEGRKKPGAVVFSDGKRFSTFEPAPIAAATGNEGQVAEYTTEQNGEYTNLRTLRVLGSREAVVVAGVLNAATAPRGEIIDLGTERLTKATQDVAAAVREMNSNLIRFATVLVNAAADQIGKAPVSLPDDPLVADDAITVAQARLAVEVGEDAAAAQFSAIMKKHKTDDARVAAAGALLAAHGIEA